MNEQKPISGADTKAYEASLKQLFAFTKMDAIVGQMAGAFMMQAKAAISAKSEAANPDVLAQTLAFFEEEYQAETPALMAGISELYRSVFSKEDIDAVVGFYTSAVGQKFLQGGVQVEQQLQSIAQTWAQAAGKAAFERATGRVNNA